ncbi:hypothetical protein KBD69_04740 [Candidatus Woesebacteria bacterium]|nr:hypothetical protein [Candidatus Woesebacteria bacterium]
MDDIRPINLDTNNQPEGIPMQPVQSKKNLIMPILLIIGVVGGLFLGYQLAKDKLLLAGGDATPGASKLAQNPDSAASVKAGDVFGAADEKTFRDQAEGVLQPGGIEGEGSHHIERGANASQWVYVTSSVVDLDLFIGHQVTVWGETNSGKKAGWLMDVGRLKVQELNAAEINNIEPAE